MNFIKLRLLNISNDRNKIFNKHIFYYFKFWNSSDIQLFFIKIIEELGFPKEQIGEMDTVFLGSDDDISVDRFESKKFNLWVVYNNKYIELIFETEEKNKELLLSVIKKYCTFPFDKK